MLDIVRRRVGVSTHLIDINRTKQKKASQEAKQLQKEVPLMPAAKLKIGGHEVGEELTELFNQMVDLLANNCSLQIEGIPEIVPLHVANNMLKHFKPNINRINILNWVKSGDLKKVDVPDASNPGQLFVTRDSVEKLSDKLREEELEGWMEVWDIEHKLGIKE